MTASADVSPTFARYGTSTGRWVLLATVLGSGIAMLDATVVNIAVPAIGRDFDAGFASLQWTINAYTLTLAGFLLVGGSLGDRFGRRRVFVTGVVWFGVASALCAVAPTVETLIAARALQGIGAALLTPGSLAIIEATFHPDDRGAAIGAWSGLGGVASALGPFVGGYLIDAVSWRLIFVVNLPIAALVVWIAARHVPETRNPAMRGVPLDAVGAVLAAAGLAGVTYALTAGAGSGWGSASVLATGSAGGLALASFVLVELRSTHPLVPFGLFRSRQFGGANAVTLFVYAALSGSLFLLPIQLQQSVSYTPLQSGAALVPLTIVMLVLSARVGRLAQRIGPRPLMTLGPLLMAVGLVLMSRVAAGGTYAGQVLPAVLTLAFGLTLMVAPLTTVAMQSAGDAQAGVASAINNDVARVAGLLAVAVVPVVAGISGGDYRDPAALTDGFRTAAYVTAGLCVVGGLLALALIRGRPTDATASPTSFCPLDAPPLRATAPVGRV